jgi:hypothetical protein
MHPIFIALFIETDADDFVAEEHRRRVRRSRRVSASGKTSLVTTTPSMRADL